MAEIVEEKKHAVLGPSGASRWLRCPGSVVLEEGQPDNSSVHARWGTCAHEVAGLILEKTVKDGVWEPENAEAYVGRVFQIEEHDVEFDMEMADCVNDYVGYVESYWSPGDTMIVEQAVPIDHLTGEEDATGTADCIIIKHAEQEIVVIDLKGGRGVAVDAFENEQGLMYASGAEREHDLFHGPFKRVLIVIVQPRLNSVSEWPLGIDEFRDWEERIREGAKEVSSNQFANAAGQEIKLVAGEKQCRFCKAKSFCPELKGEVSAALQLTAPPARADEFPDLSLPKQAAAADASTADPDALAKAWKALPLIDAWASAVRDRVHTLLHEAKPVGDLCLYSGKRGARFWTDKDKAEKELRKSRLKVADLFSMSLVSPTQAEKLYKSGVLSETYWAKACGLIGQKDGAPVVGVQGEPGKTPWSPCAPEEFPDLDADDLFS